MSSFAPEERRAWVLNLDAEHELEAERRYAPTDHLRRLVAREHRRLIGELVAPGDVVITPDSPVDAGAAAGLPGFAWCPTPRAVAALIAAGANPVTAPDVGVLRRVNARPFAVDVRAPFARESFTKEVFTHLEGVLEKLAQSAPDGWLVRRAFGAAGRGRRRIATGSSSHAERAWLAAGLRKGPLLVEPWVLVTREYTRSGWVESDGRVVISQPCFQETTKEGAWTRSEIARSDDVKNDDDTRVEAMAEAAGRALARAGYFGPFGIDAFRHRLPGARTGDVLNPMSEINARFTMDWGMGNWAQAIGEVRTGSVVSTT